MKMQMMAGYMLKNGVSWDFFPPGEWKSNSDLYKCYFLNKDSGAVPICNMHPNCRNILVNWVLEIA